MLLLNKPQRFSGKIFQVKGINDVKQAELQPQKEMKSQAQNMFLCIVSNSLVLVFSGRHLLS